MTLYGSDREVLHTAAQWLEQGHDVALVTVARTWGSSPRPVGSLMVMRDDGIHAGSVSGGCVEQDLVARYRDRQIAGPGPAVVDYGVDREQAGRLGLPCGGRLELVIERVGNVDAVAALLARMSAGELVARRVCLTTGVATLHPASAADTFEYDGQSMRKVFGPAWHLLIIGAGQLARYVAELARMLDYRVTVCDPRAEYSHDWQVPGIEFVQGMPDDAVVQLANNRRSAIVALTHDPKLDDLALLEALDSEAFYVGALGSRRNNEQRRKRLAELGLSARQLARLHGPVGLPIGGRTAAEIALAILAEITAARYGVTGLTSRSVSAA